MRVKVFISGLLFAVFCFYCLSYSGVPQMINYQGKLTTPQGALIDTVVSIRFCIYADPVTLNPLWTETQGSVKVEKGIFSVLLGSLTPIPDSVFEGGLRYLGVKVGSDAEMKPRKVVGSVAYALHAGKADQIVQPEDGWCWSIDPNRMHPCDLNDSVGIGTQNPREKLDVHGNIHATGRIQSGGGIALCQEHDAVEADRGKIILRNFCTETDEPNPPVKVGIGTDDPGDYKLAIQATGNYNYLSMSEDHIGGADGFQFQIAPGDGTQLTRRGYLRGNFGHGTGFYIYNERNAPLRFGTNDLERMRITGDGNVGIGTSTPEAKLHVEGVALDGVYGVSDDLTGVIGKSNFDTTGEAGVRAIGNGTDGPGDLRAAALEIQNGAIWVSGNDRPAGKIHVSGIDWNPISSCTSSPENHSHVIGQYKDVTLTNNLITPYCIILLTVQTTVDQPCYAEVRSISYGSAEIRVTAVDCTAPTYAYVQYLIINFEEGYPPAND